ncbi:MAG: hypothetical protein AB7O32_07925 [Vicinamibacterales bacterium]
MSIVDDLIENLVERNVIRVNGSLSISLTQGGLSVKGQIFSTVRDQKRNKDILHVKAPVDADLRVGTIVVPLPQIR